MITVGRVGYIKEAGALSLNPNVPVQICGLISRDRKQLQLCCTAGHQGSVGANMNKEKVRTAFLQPAPSCGQQVQLTLCFWQRALQVLRDCWQIVVKTIIFHKGPVCPEHGSNKEQRIHTCVWVRLANQKQEQYPEKQLIKMFCFVLCCVCVCVRVYVCVCV